jgi:signal transduction histidine kinase
VIQDQIAAANKDGSAWLDLYWYKPGQNTPARKRTFVRKVQSGPDTYIVGAGIYLEE